MISKLIVIGWTLVLGYTFIAGAAEFSDTQPSDAVMGIAIMFSMIVHFLLWCAVAIPTFVISRMFKRACRRDALGPGAA